MKPPRVEGGHQPGHPELLLAQVEHPELLLAEEEELRERDGRKGDRVLTDEFRCQYQRMLAESESLLAGTECLLAENECLLAESECLRAERECLLAESECLLAERDRLAESERLLAESELLYAESQRSYAESQRQIRLNQQLEEEKQAISPRARYLRDKYIQCGRFEEFCSIHGVHGEDMIEIGRGRLTAALFTEAFLHHLTTLLQRNTISIPQEREQNLPLPTSKAYSAGLPQLLKEAANLVVKDLPYATKTLHEGDSQSFQFFDEVCNGDLVNVHIVFSLGGLIGVCQNFSQGEKKAFKDLETDFSNGYCIVQHDLTGIYLCRRIETKVFEDRLIKNAIGVLGVEVTGEDIHVENTRDDGSYYCGTLKDFSYQFVFDKNGDLKATDKQCATKIFGHFKGAGFLVEMECGLKCSPLLAIALAIATRRKNLSLKWNRTQGHMEIENSEHFRFENVKWQILYTDKINQLGLAVEWGMEQVMAIEMANSQVVGTSKQNSQVVGTSKQNYHENLQSLAAVFGNAVQQKRTVGLQVNLPGGAGAGVSFEIYGSKGKELSKEAHSGMMECLWRQEGKFVETSNLDAKHAHVKEDLLQGRLPDAPYNYLVAWDDADNGHVSVYWAMEDGKLEWITDILLPGGKGEHKKLFKGRLKGLRMKIKRKGSKLVCTNVCKSASDFMSHFKNHKKLDIDNSMVQVPSGSQSNDEWVHLIGSQAKYSGNKFLWEATYMRAIISSRTSYLSGAILKTYVLDSKFGEIGNCTRSEFDAPLAHHCDRVVAWGQYSKAPASLVHGSNLIKWGGLIDENDLC